MIGKTVYFRCMNKDMHGTVVSENTHSIWVRMYGFLSVIKRSKKKHNVREV